MGSTWIKLTSHKKTGEYYQLHRDTNGNIWVSHGLGKDEIYFRLNPTDKGLTLKQLQKPKFDFHSTEVKIPVTKGIILNGKAVKGASGQWAATRRGPYYKANNSSAWVTKSGNLAAAPITKLIASPINKEALLWGEGTLWLSINQGKHWSLVRTGPNNYVQHANFLNDESIAVGYEHNSITIIRNGKVFDIDPKPSYFKNIIKARLKYSPRAERIKILALGGDSKKLWVVAGNPIMYFKPEAVAKRFSQVLAKTFALNKNKNKNKSNDNERHYIGLFIYTPDSGWRTEPLSKLAKYELNRYKRKHDNLCTLNVKSGELYINDKKIPSSLLQDTVSRAGWIKNSSEHLKKRQFYSMSDWRLQIGTVKNCRLSGSLYAWGLDSISINNHSVLFNTANGFKILTPRNTRLESVQINYQSPPLWRWGLFYLAFGPGFYIAWGLILIWAWVIYRTKKL